MRAYYFDNLPGDQRLPHDYVPSRAVEPEKLASLKVLFWRIPVEGYEDAVNEVAKERGYKNRDTINVSKEGMGDIYEEKIRGFFEEYAVVLSCLDRCMSNSSDVMQAHARGRGDQIHSQWKWIFRRQR
jgi:hypothetical protein